MRLTSIYAQMLALLLLLGMSCPAPAHDVPPSIAVLDIGRKAIDIELQLQLSELGVALTLPLTSSPSTVIPRYGSMIEQYIQDRLQVHGRDGSAFALHIASLGMRRTSNANWMSNDWLIVHARLQAPQDASTASMQRPESWFGRVTSRPIPARRIRKPKLPCGDLPLRHLW